MRVVSVTVLMTESEFRQSAKVLEPKIGESISAIHTRYPIFGGTYPNGEKDVAEVRIESAMVDLSLLQVADLLGCICLLSAKKEAGHRVITDHLRGKTLAELQGIAGMESIAYHKGMSVVDLIERIEAKWSATVAIGP